MRTSQWSVRDGAGLVFAAALVLGPAGCGKSDSDAESVSGLASESSDSTATSATGSTAATSSPTTSTSAATDPSSSTTTATAPTSTGEPPASTSEATTEALTTDPSTTTDAACGGDGEPCCAGDTCAAFHACQEGTCALQCEFNECVAAGVAEGNACDAEGKQVLCKPDIFTHCPEPFNAVTCAEGCDDQTGLCAGCEANHCQQQGAGDEILCNGGTDFHCALQDGCRVVLESHQCTNACFAFVGCCGSAAGEPCCNGNNCSFGAGLVCVDGACMPG